MDFGMGSTMNWSVSVYVGDQQRLIFLPDIYAGHCQSSDSTLIFVDLPSSKHCFCSIADLLIHVELFKYILF